MASEAMSSPDSGGAARRRERIMGGNFSFGRVGGIDVRLHWSLLAVFVLIVWSLADGVFPSQNEGLSGRTYLAMALVAAVLFLASVLLHELGHSWVARREGIEVDSITLWLFGGVAEFKDRFASAGAEFRVAVSGPLISVGLGVGFMLIALAGLPSAVDGVAAWLGYINLILAAFNLLPASPLDGGRVLHAGLWRARTDFAWATRVASEIGQAFAYLFIALGLVMFVFEGSFSGAWLAFIGWFLLGAASSETRFLAVRDALAGLRVRDLMVRDPATVSPSVSLGRFMDDVVWKRRYTTYPVVEDGRAVGLLPFRCVAAVPRSEWETRSVRDCMLRREDVPVLDEVEELVDAGADAGSVPPQELRDRRHVLGDRLVGEQPDLLDGVADLAPQLGAAHRGVRLAVYEDIALGGLDEPVYHPHRRGLAAPRRAHQNANLSFEDLEGEVVDDGLLRAGVGLAHPPKPDHCISCAPTDSTSARSICCALLNGSRLLRSGLGNRSEKYT